MESDDTSNFAAVNIALESDKKVKLKKLRNPERVGKKQKAVDGSPGVTVVTETPLLGAGLLLLKKFGCKTSDDSDDVPHSPLPNSVNVLPETVEKMNTPIDASPGVTVVAGTPQIVTLPLGLRQLSSGSKDNSDLVPSTPLANCSFLKKSTPNKTQTTSHQMQTTRNQKLKTESQQQTTPNKKQTASSQQQTTPSPKQTTPNPKQTSSQQQTTQSPKQKTPNPKQTTPNQKQTAPNQEQTTPNPKQTTPSPKQTTPNPKQTTPSQKQTTPSPKQTTPSPKQTTPIPKQKTPNPKQTTPNPKQTTLSPKQTTRSPKQTTLSPKQKTPNPKQTTLSQKQMTVNQKQTTPSQKQAAIIITSSSTKVKSASDEWRPIPTRQPRILTEMSEKSLSENVQDQAETVSSSANSSSTEDLDTTHEDIQFEIPNLDLQPEEIKFRLTQLSEDANSVTGSQVIQVPESDEVNSNKCVLSTPDNINGSDIVLSAANVNTIPESINEADLVINLKDQGIHLSSLGGFSDTDQTNDRVNHCSTDQQQTEINSPINSYLNQESSKVKKLNRNNKLKLKGKSDRCQSKDVVESSSDERGRDTVKYVLNSPRLDANVNADVPTATNPTENIKITENKSNYPVGEKDYGSSVDSQTSTVLNSASDKDHVSTEKTNDSGVYNTNVLTNSNFSVDVVPCTCSPLTLSASNPKIESPSHCPRHPSKSVPAQDDVPKVSGESESTVFETASDQSISILAPVSNKDKNTTPEVFEVLNLLD
ncbi:proteoglycan 4-like [Gigantopelta aegis]|uniref:proteoglycan 4-like n=1 Tax=Gigantopelta aegis TaxID=1735272 RepID=UPI001B88A4C7|nr:proteoglycan 4-like [Gigantopelta aegis]